MNDDFCAENILGFSVRHSGVCECARDICSWVRTGDGARWAACINPHSYVEALRQPRFSEALRAADWLLPDGVGIVLASAFLGGSIRERVTGSDVFHEISRLLNDTAGCRYFFLGATEETLEAIRSRLGRDYPNIVVAGTYSPPFKEEFSKSDLEEMIAAVNAARPEVLWVGMTAPKQELWIRQNLGMLPTVKFAAAIGAVFDFYSGRVKRSHPMFQRLGFEWLPRLLRQPSRLWRRMLVSAPVFVWHVMRARARR